jgi:hypothetical protein
MNGDIKFSEFFGPASLFGVLLGTAYLMLIVLRVIEVGVGFGALVIVGFPLMLASGALKRFGTGLVVSLAVVPLTLVTFLIGASVGSSLSG